MEENINYSTNNLNVQWMRWCKHIRLRTGMYIGRIGDGSNPCDGVYTLFTQILNNSIDEFRRGFGNLIEVTVDGNSFSVRDYGLGIEPKMALQDEYCEMSASQNQGVPLTITIGGIYLGLRLNIALSSSFTIVSHRQAKEEWMKAKNGVIVASGCGISKCPQGTLVSVSPDAEIFGENTIRQQYIEKLVKTSVCLNPGLTILLNGKKYKSENGLLDIVNEHLTEGISYPPIHLKGKNIEIVLVHSQRKESNITSFVNGHFTKDGGRHQRAFISAIVTTLNEFYGVNYNTKKCLSGITGAVSVNVLDPLFENATKSILSSFYMDEIYPYEKGTIKIRTYVKDFIATNLPIYLFEHKDTAEIIRQKLFSLV